MSLLHEFLSPSSFSFDTQRIKQMHEVARTNQQNVNVNLLYVNTIQNAR